MCVLNRGGTVYDTCACPTRILKPLREHCAKQMKMKKYICITGKADAGECGFCCVPVDP